ncbi:MAG: YcxB family protein [Firmicutes bacterium]|nr:YcxB family protein [Bacillota bacterium]
MDKIDVRYTFGQKEYARAVRQYLLAGGIIKRRDFLILPLLLIILLTVLFNSRFNQWMLFITLLCVTAILLTCGLYFIKPWQDHQKKPQIREEIKLSFSEEGMIFPTKNPAIVAVWDNTLENNTIIAKIQPKDGTAPANESAPPETSVEASKEEGQLILEREAAASKNDEAASLLQEKINSESDAAILATSNKTEEKPLSRKGLLAQRKKQQKNQAAPTTKNKQQAMIKWDRIAEAWENREFIYLILQRHLYYIVPKRSFANQEELRYFQRILYRRVGIVENVGPYR